MPRFGRTSKERLMTVHEDIIKVMNRAIEIVDFSVVCGYRGKEKQDEAFRNKKSKCRFPKSKHNSEPSMAIDIAPYPIDWEDRERFFYMAGVVMTMAKLEKVKLKWGGDWGWDLPHFELIS